MSEVHIAGFAVAVFGKNHHAQSFGGEFAPALGGQSVEGGAIEQHHHIGILFYGAALAQVAQSRALVGAHFALAVQLAKQNDGNIQFFGNEFGFAAGFRHFLFAVTVLLSGLHFAELQVVDDEEVAASLAFLQQGGRTDVIHAHLRIVVHVDRQGRQQPGGFQCLLPFAGIEQSGLEVSGIHVGRLGAEPTVAQPFALHLKAVHQYMLSDASCRQCQMQGKSSLSHRGAGGDDVQVALLPARRKPVKLAQSGGNTGDAVPVVFHTLVHLLKGVLHEAFHIAQAVVGDSAAFQMSGKAVQICQSIAQVHRLIGSAGKQSVQPCNHLTPDVHLPEDERMVFQMGGRRHAPCQAHQLVGAAHRLQLAT